MNAYCYNVTCPRYNKETFVSEKLPWWYVEESVCGECGEYSLHPDPDPLAGDLNHVSFRDWIASQPTRIQRWDDEAIRLLDAFAAYWRQKHEESN